MTCRIAIPVVCLLIAVASPRANAATPPTTGINLHPTVPESMGVEIHFTDPRPGEMQALAATGIRWVRMDLVWANTEKARGRYDFSAYDRLLAALSPYGIRTMFILDYGNPLYGGGLPPHNDEVRAAFARWAAAAVGHFAGRGIVWELWNEPNFIRFWGPKPNAEDYSKLALTTAEALLESTPGETLVGPASAVIDLRFLDSCFRAGLLNYFSAVTVHPYRQQDPETATGDLQAVGRLIAHYGPKNKQIPIIPSEWGYSAGWKPMKGMDVVMQAQMLAREFLNNLAIGVPLTIWYEWTDDNSAGDDPEGLFGLIKTPEGSAKPRYVPKPAYRAAMKLTRTFKGYRFERRVQLDSPDDYALVFTNGHDQRLAAWRRAADGSAHNVTIPGFHGRFTTTPYLGGRATPVTAGAKGLTLRISRDPVYVSRR